jgi:lysozyme family protein
MNVSDIDFEHMYSYMVIKPDWLPLVIKTAKRIHAGFDRYEKAAAVINSKIPAAFIGIVHYMECDCDFTKHIHNGDSLKRRTIDVPKGRPLADPVNGFPAGYLWLESAVDAFKLMGFDKEESWSLKEMLYRFESYNGFGCERYHNLYSPYLWSGTNFYSIGKYDTDGHWNRIKTSEQVGAAPLLLYLTDKTKEVG